MKRNKQKLADMGLTRQIDNYFIEQIKWLNWHRKKLKTGRIGFEIHETVFYGIPIYYYLDVRFIRQNNLESDEKRIDHILDRQAYKNNFKDNTALSSSLSILFWEIYQSLLEQYQKRLPTLAFRSELSDTVLHIGLTSSFKSKKIGVFERYSFLSDWIVDVLLDFCINWNIIF